jgi:hypothetical protein
MGDASQGMPSRATCLTFEPQARVVLRGSVNGNGLRLRLFRQDPVGRLKFSYRFDLRFLFGFAIVVSGGKRETV